jgi:hypothetical protein
MGNKKTILLRRAEPGDAEALAELITDLGYPVYVPVSPNSANLVIWLNLEIW